MKYKVLTLTQPWATLVAIGAKRIETRGWSTSYRGPLLIHAAKGLDGMKESEMWDRALSEPFRTALFSSYPNPGRLPRGAIVAVCELVAVGTMEAFAMTGWEWSGFTVTGQERAFGDYSDGRFAWLLDKVCALPEPIPARGQLGLWAWDGDIGV